MIVWVLFIYWDGSIWENYVLETAWYRIPRAEYLKIFKKNLKKIFLKH